MSEQIRAGLPGGPRPLESVRPDAAGSARPSATRPAFEALLQDLEQRARALEADSARIEAPAELAEAVQRAEDSLQAALSVQERLLEAFRERLARPSPARDSSAAVPPEAGTAR